MSECQNTVVSSAYSDLRHEGAEPNSGHSLGHTSVTACAAEDFGAQSYVRLLAAAPVADRFRELVGCIRGDEVAGTLDDDGPMMGERPFPPP